MNLSGTYSDGLISHYIDGLEITVHTSTDGWRRILLPMNPGVWHQRTEFLPGHFNGSDNGFSLDEINSKRATFAGVSESDRVFGKKGNDTFWWSRRTCDCEGLQRRG